MLMKKLRHRSPPRDKGRFGQRARPHEFVSGLDTILDMDKPPGPAHHFSQFLRSHLALSPVQAALRL
jgi:hypothetical protein